jgi:hypothetical protein
LADVQPIFQGFLDPIGLKHCLCQCEQGVFLGKLVEMARDDTLQRQEDIVAKSR